MSRNDKRRAIINDISKDARRAGELAAEWGWSHDQLERAIDGMRRMLIDLGADDWQTERIVKAAVEGYRSHSNGGSNG